jgi:hypothetical protein
MSVRAVVEALNRGELVRLLAEFDSGKLDGKTLEDALDEYSKARWFRRFLFALLGR